MSARKRPLYARMLLLRQLTLRPAVAFLLFEGSIGLGVLLALADIVNGWGIVAVPVTVAVMVKLNDVFAGALAQAPHVAPVGVPPVVTGEAPVPPQNRATQPGRGASMRRTRAIVGRARLGSARGIVYVHADPPDPRRPGSVSATAALPAATDAPLPEPVLDSQSDPHPPTEAQAPAARAESRDKPAARAESRDKPAARAEGREKSAARADGSEESEATAVAVPLTSDSSAVPARRSDAAPEGRRSDAATEGRRSDAATEGRRSDAATDAGSVPRSEETDAERKLADRGTASLDLAAAEPTCGEPGDQAAQPRENDRPSPERAYPDRTDRNKGRFA